MTYTRRYYQNKSTGEYSYLLDSKLGIEKYRRVDTKLRTILVETCAKYSYQKTLEIVKSDLSRTSVMNFVREYHSKLGDQLVVKTSKKVPKVLYIEADEDHIKYQNGKSGFLKLVYIHEGYDQNKMVDPYYIAGTYHGKDGNDELWSRVLRYGEAYKDATIYFTSDGGAWLKEGVKWIPNCIYVLDRFHTAQACRRASKGIRWQKENKLLVWLNEGAYEEFMDFLDVRQNDPELIGGQRKQVLQNLRYLEKNYEAIQRQKDKAYQKCSTEGQISHHLSERFSSRPQAWSQAGLDAVSWARMELINGIDLKERMTAYLRKYQKQIATMKLDKRLNISRKIENKYYIRLQVHFPTVKTRAKHLLHANKNIKTRKRMTTMIKR
ncbi:ISLre2 family transposase [Ligilactobacillus animalis]|uniref:ISLre2 family transposase n=1 Tax=Ligilactobacillus animalis TaxID=1605 RepID=UPI0025954A12|nr:ISLre2 family transposase [Ligilactobacillus animalis]